MILDKIVENTKNQVARRKSKVPRLAIRQAAESISEHRANFCNTLKQPGINIIAEVKKASPSKGVLCHEFDPVSIAREYAKGGAAALSVLTDESFFQGHLNFLDDIAAHVDKPLLRKDFVIDEYQIYEARLHRASAVLLLAVLLDSVQLSEFLVLSGSLGLDALVEVHNDQELEKVLQTNAMIIGVNNRDLATFTLSLQTSLELAQKIPDDKLKVSESGINTSEDIKLLRAAGFHAFLIGESLMKQADRITALRALRGA
ncbi:indole-3-glycerol phosphate synthase TrpC [candidate division KSB1 bacterium]|nr:indole-3-glycerol phosphate synthase TrpC [candidate division KSB1 bacterium]RQW00937.1 MAG: indole-3-glycerol phosphate synthase TrpC [candidate division KSB1 bacterium]